MMFRLTIGLVWLVLSSVNLAQSLVSTVDKNQLSETETLRLSVTYDSNIRTDALDLSSLTQDFEILSSTAGSSVQIINNQRSQATTWQIVLLPKRTGNLVIPSFSLGNIVSDAIQIQVLESGDLSSSNQPLSVEMRIDKSSAFVGEQIIVNVTLRARSDLSNLSGEELRIDGVDVQLANQSSKNEIINGVSWQIIEWTYALFPQQPGTLAIPKQLFSGRLSTGQRRGFFGTLSGGEPILARSEARVVNVEDPSALTSAGKLWFPASDVTISSSWSSDPSTLTVGEPLTRTVEIRAQGQRAAAISPFDESDNGSDQYSLFKEYRDTPVLNDEPGINGVTSTRRESAAIVPSQEGILEIPQQIVDWWDTDTREWRQAILPAESYEVMPALGNNSFSPPKNFEAIPTPTTDTNTLNGLPAQNASAPSQLWKWTTILLSLVIAIQAFMLVNMRRAQPGSMTQVNPLKRESDSEKAAWKQLSQALRSNNLAEIRKNLLSWSRAAWPERSLHSIDSLAEASDSDTFKKSLKNLDRALFKGDKGNEANFDADSVAELREEIEKLRNSAVHSQKHADTSTLAPLYPQSL